jgi:hypothetical protein
VRRHSARAAISARRPATIRGKNRDKNRDKMHGRRRKTRIAIRRAKNSVRNVVSRRVIPRDVRRLRHRNRMPTGRHHARLIARHRRAIIVMRAVTTADTIRVSIAARRHRVIIARHAASRHVTTAVTNATVGLRRATMRAAMTGTGARYVIAITMTVRRSARLIAATTRAIGVTPTAMTRAKIRVAIRVTTGAARRRATIVMRAATIVVRRQGIQETIATAVTTRVTSPAMLHALHPSTAARCCVNMSTMPAASSRSSANSAVRRCARRRIATATLTLGGIGVKPPSVRPRESGDLALTNSDWA